MFRGSFFVFTVVLCGCYGARDEQAPACSLSHVPGAVSGYRQERFTHYYAVSFDVEPGRALAVVGEKHHVSIEARDSGGAHGCSPATEAPKGAT